MEEAVTWAAASDPPAARRLQQAFGKAARLLGAHPDAGRQQALLVGDRYRVWSVTGFPYLMVYDPAPRPPRIIRVLHTARDLLPILAYLRDR